MLSTRHVRRAGWTSRCGFFRTAQDVITKGWEIWGNPARYSTERKIDHLSKERTLYHEPLPVQVNRTQLEDRILNSQNTLWGKLS